MLIASCLAAFGTLRRSEICPLLASDVSGNFVRINKAMVDAGKSEWIIKLTNKNKSSNRIVEYPECIINILPTSGRLVNLNPDQITRRHERALRLLASLYSDFTISDIIQHPLCTQLASLINT